MALTWRQSHLRILFIATALLSMLDLLHSNATVLHKIQKWVIIVLVIFDLCLFI